MTDLERLAVVALRYKKGYDDSNPDVGMGPRVESLLSDLLKEASLKESSVDTALVISRAKQQYPWVFRR